MNENDTAYKLAEAAKNLYGDQDALDKEIARLKPTARDIARAYERVFYPPFSGTSAANQFALRARLDVALVEEHVAAQRKMGRAVNWLNGVLVGLTFALVYFAWVDYHVHQQLPPPTDSAAWEKWAKDFWYHSSPK